MTAAGGPRCPACLAAPLVESDRASVDRLADAWARQDAWAGVSVTELRARIRADVGADAVAFYACGRCGLESAHPPRAWTSGNYPPEEYGLCWDHVRALERLADRRPARLLEIGCAEGTFLERAAALGCRVMGIDFTAHRVAAARARGLDAHVADVTEAARIAGPERFDAVAMFQVIEHLETPDVVFEGINALTAPGAMLLAACPAPRRFTRRMRHADRVGGADFWDFPPMHVLRWTEESLRVFLARHGWRLAFAESEPFSLVGAAAHLTAIDGKVAGWYGAPLRRRLETIARLGRLAAAQARAPMTGIRLLVGACREPAA